jgi:hypothetical protein
MVSGPNPKKRKLNEISNYDSNNEEKKQDPTTLQREINQLKTNYSAALNWIKDAE